VRQHARQLSTRRARLVKLADKICNIRDVAANPPRSWPLPAAQGVLRLGQGRDRSDSGTNKTLEKLFDDAFAGGRSAKDASCATTRRTVSELSPEEVV